MLKNLLILIINTSVDIRVHLHFFLIQAVRGLKLGEGSRGCVWIAVHVRAARAAIQLLPAAVTIPLLACRRNPGKMCFLFGYSCHSS